MGRKIKMVSNELIKVTQDLEQALARVEEVKQIQQQAIDEEKNILESTENQIKELCEQHDLFCGIILTTPDLLTIIQMAIESKEQINIPFRLYPKDN